MKATEYIAQKKRARALRAIRRDSVAGHLAQHAQKLTHQRDQAVAKLRKAYELGAEDMRIRCLSVPGLTAKQCAAITAIATVEGDAEPEPSGSSGSP